MHSYAPMNSNIVKLLHLGHHTALYSLSRIELRWPIMLGYY